MALYDPVLDPPGGLLFADVTQSWSEVGGGVRTYLRHKRRHILDNTPHRHLLVVPGQRDDLDIEADGRGMTVTIASPKVPGSPHYRLMLRNWAVRSVLAEHRPDLIECQDAYNLPWAAIGHRQAIPTHRPGRGLLHRLPDGLCGSAVREMARAASRRRGFASLLRLLLASSTAGSMQSCNERKRRRGEASLARRSGCRCGAAGRRARPILPGETPARPAPPAWPDRARSPC